MKILCINDLESNRKLLATLLESKGHEIVFADDPIEALRTIEQQSAGTSANENDLQPELLSRDRNWKSFFSSATAGLAIIDADQRFLHLNETLAKMNGVPIASHLGRRIREIIPSLADTIEGFHKRVMSGEPILNVEFSGEVPSNPGAVRQWSTSYFPIYGNCTNPTGMGAIVVDITEQKKAKLRDEAFASLGRQLSAATNQREAGQIIATVSDKLFGWDVYTFDAYHDEENKTAAILHFDLIDGRRVEVATGGDLPSPRQKRIIQQGPLLILRDSPYTVTDEADLIGDTARPSASIMCVPIRNGSKVLGLLSIQSYKAQAYSNEDLNVLQNLGDHCGAALERIKAEENLRTTAEQLRQAQKMEAIGRLAGGVAHDFNNLLTVITGYSDVLLFDESLGKERADQLKEIAAAAHRAAGLTRQLLAFSRKQKITLKPVNLNEVIEDLMKMLRRIIGEDVRLENSFAPRLPLIQADNGMMEQVLMNLAVNARDAMENGGKLFINTDTVTITSDHVRNNPGSRAGEFVCLSVRDTGCGMPPEILARLFEPFFTTKDQGKGTGLGLATVYGITQQHHGWIEVESTMGAGTTFKLFFPTTDRKNIKEQKATRPKIRGGTETILLVEDDAGVRSLARHVLRRYGYNIIEAQSGVEALKVWDEVGGKIDLLLTDIVMPDGITGPDLAKRLTEKKTNLPILFTSGYSLTAIGPDVDLRDGENFLQKPYHPEKLATLVRHRLDGQ